MVSFTSELKWRGGLDTLAARPGPAVGGGNRLEREGTELTDESFRQATG